MKQIDFEYVNKVGRTIFYAPYWNLGTSDEKLTVLKFLVTEGEKNGFDVNSILEKPNIWGETCLTDYNDYKTIFKYLLDRGIKLNSIGPTLRTMKFKYPDLAVQMMSQGKVHQTCV